MRHIKPQALHFYRLYFFSFETSTPRLCSRLCYSTNDLGWCNGSDPRANSKATFGRAPQHLEDNSPLRGGQSMAKQSWDPARERCSQSIARIIEAIYKVFSSLLNYNYLYPAHPDKWRLNSNIMMILQQETTIGPEERHRIEKVFFETMPADKVSCVVSATGPRHAKEVWTSKARWEDYLSCSFCHNNYLGPLQWSRMIIISWPRPNGFDS